MATFSVKQKELLKIAKKKGFLTLTDFVATYSCSDARKANVERLLALGILTADPKVADKFLYHKEALE